MLFKMICVLFKIFFFKVLENVGLNNFSFVKYLYWKNNFNSFIFLQNLTFIFGVPVLYRFQPFTVDDVLPAFSTFTFFSKQLSRYNIVTELPPGYWTRNHYRAICTRVCNNYNNNYTCVRRVVIKFENDIPPVEPSIGINDTARTAFIRPGCRFVH